MPLLLHIFLQQVVQPMTLMGIGMLSILLRVSREFSFPKIIFSKNAFGISSISLYQVNYRRHFTLIQTRIGAIFING